MEGEGSRLQAVYPIKTEQAERCGSRGVSEGALESTPFSGGGKAGEDCGGGGGVQRAGSTLRTGLLTSAQTRSDVEAG